MNSSKQPKPNPENQRPPKTGLDFASILYFYFDFDFLRMILQVFPSQKLKCGKKQFNGRIEGSGCHLRQHQRQRLSPIRPRFFWLVSLSSQFRKITEIWFDLISFVGSETCLFLSEIRCIWTSLNPINDEINVLPFDFGADFGFWVVGIRLMLIICTQNNHQKKNKKKNRGNACQRKNYWADPRPSWISHPCPWWYHQWLQLYWWVSSWDIFLGLGGWFGVA